MLNPTAVVVVHKQPPTSTLSITMREVHPLRSSLVVLLLQNSRHRMSADPKIDLFLSPLLEVPTVTILQTGDHDPAPFLENLSPEAGNRFTSCKMWCRGLVFQGVYLIVNSAPISCVSYHDFPGCIRLFRIFVFLPLLARL